MGGIKLGHGLLQRTAPSREKILCSLLIRAPSNLHRRGQKLIGDLVVHRKGYACQEALPDKSPFDSFFRSNRGPSVDFSVKPLVVPTR